MKIQFTSIKMDVKFNKKTLFKTTVEQLVSNVDFIVNDLNFFKQIQTILNSAIFKADCKIKQDKLDSELVQYEDETINERIERAKDEQEWIISTIRLQCCDNDGDDCVHRSCMMSSDVNIYRLKGAITVLCKDCLSKNYNDGERVRWLINREYGKKYDNYFIRNIFH